MSLVHNMQSQPPNTQGPGPLQPNPALGVQAPVASIPNAPQAPPPMPVPQVPQVPMHPVVAAGANTPGSRTPTLEELRDGLDYEEGEMPVLERNDSSWATKIRVEPLAMQIPKDLPWYNCFSDEFSWNDGFGVLLGNYWTETTPTNNIKSSQMIRPIPLECLRFASFNDEQEPRAREQGFMKRILCCCNTAPLPDPMYPFTIYHSAAKITRRHTLYTRSATERNRWHTALESAIAERQSQHDGKMLYTTKLLNDRFFRIAPRIQFTRGVHYTGRTVCAAGFTYPSQGEGYIAVGCTTGIYISKRAIEYSFRKVLEFNEPTSIAAIPIFDKFLVHCEKALYSYPLDLIIRAFRGEATFKDLEISMERLAKEHGSVSFLKTDSIKGRTLVIYAANDLKQTSTHILELTREGVDPAKYQHLSSITIPNDPHDAVIFGDNAAICASKAVYIVEPLKTTDPSYKEAPNLLDSKPGKNFWPFSSKNKGDPPKILDLIDKANVLGVVPYLNDILIVYEDFGCFVDLVGKPARTLSYYAQWERRASAYIRREAHLLLLSPGYIEVRTIESCKLVQIVETNEMRLLRSSLTDPVPIAAMIGGTEDDGGRTEKIVELTSNEY